MDLSEFSAGVADSVARPGPSRALSLPQQRGADQKPNSAQPTSPQSPIEPVHSVGHASQELSQFPVEGAPDRPNERAPDQSISPGQSLVQLEPVETEEGNPLEDEFEIDPESDPLQESAPWSVAEWEAAVRQINPRQPIVEDPVELREKVEALLERIRDVSILSDPSRQAEAEAVLTSLPDILKNPDQFVAGTFTSCYPAWEALLKSSKRKSAKTVLG